MEKLIVEKLIGKAWFLSSPYSPVLRITVLIAVLTAIALAAGAPGDWGGCGCG